MLNDQYIVVAVMPCLQRVEYVLLDELSGLRLWKGRVSAQTNMRCGGTELPEVPGYMIYLFHHSLVIRGLIALVIVCVSPATQ